MPIAANICPRDGNNVRRRIGFSIATKVIHEHTNTPANSASVWASEMLGLNALFRVMNANAMIGQCHRYSEYDNWPDHDHWSVVQESPHSAALIAEPDHHRRADARHERSDSREGGIHVVDKHWNHDETESDDEQRIVHDGRVRHAPDGCNSASAAPSISCHARDGSR